MAFKEFDPYVNKRQMLRFDLSQPITGLYQNSNDTLYILNALTKQYLGCFSGDNTYYCCINKKSYHLSMDWNRNATFENMILPTYERFLREHLPTILS